MPSSNSRVVVTGGAGFIGSHLVDRLLDAGHEVVVLDNFSSGSLQNLVHHGAQARLKVHAADVRDERAMRALLRGARYVFHLATQNVRLSLHQPTVVHEVNATGTLNVLKAGAAAGVQRLVYCSSSEVNGTAEVVPMSEDYHYQPETIYGASKLAGEYYAQVFHRASWLETVIARPHNNYGPREHVDGIKGEVIPRFIVQALAGLPLSIYGDGSQTRDFTYVTETADFIVRLAMCAAAAGGIYNICRGEEVSIRQLADLIAELTGQTVPRLHLPGRPSDVLRLFGDPTRLRQLLGASPCISIREGLAATVAWFRQHGRVTAELVQSLQCANWHLPASEPWLEAVRVRQNPNRQAA
jgi:UDP-glucose 4-epimerase